MTRFQEDSKSLHPFRSQLVRSPRFSYIDCSYQYRSAFKQPNPWDPSLDLEKLNPWNPPRHIYSRYTQGVSTRVEKVLSAINVRQFIMKFQRLSLTLVTAWVCPDVCLRPCSVIRCKLSNTSQICALLCSSVLTGVGPLQA